MKDLSSKNGTYVNGKRITGETSITASDVIKVGDTTLDWVKYLNKKKVNPHSFGGDFPDVKQRKTIGRIAANNDIVFDHSDVSSSHAQLIQKINGEIAIADSGSTNGTYVNGQKISMQILRPGDRVLIANKYALDWQNVFGAGKRPKIFKTAIISAVSIAAVVIGILFFVKPWEEKPWPAEKIYATYKKSVVMIEGAYYYQISIKEEVIGYFTVTKKGELDIVRSLRNAKFYPYVGTGFIVSDNGKIITNRHIVVPYEYGDTKEMATKIKEEVKKRLTDLSLTSAADFRKYAPMISEVTVEGKLHEEYFGIYLNDTHKSESSKIPCHILKEGSSGNIDIAMIQINSKTLPPGVKNIVDPDNAVMDDANIVVGEPVYTIGFPAGEIIAQTSYGLEANNQDGKITQLRDYYEFGHNITAIGGASGSPVFNRYGNLIGVINKRFSGSQGYNAAVKAKYAVELVKN